MRMYSLAGPKILEIWIDVLSLIKECVARKKILLV